MDAHDMPRFTMRAFLRDKAPILALACAVIAFVSFMLVVLGMTTDAILLIDFTLVAVLILAFILEYRRRALFWKSIGEALESLDKTRYFDEIVHEPAFLEGRIALAMARSIAEQAMREGNELRMQSHDRAQYTELWVHEVKTPLAAARLLLDKMHGEDASILKLELERVEHLVEQALFTARSDTLVNDYVIREIALGDAVGEACKANMRYLTSCGVTIDIRIDPQTTVVADKPGLRSSSPSSSSTPQNTMPKPSPSKPAKTTRRGRMPARCSRCATTVAASRPQTCHASSTAASRARWVARTGRRPAWGSSSSPACARKWGLASCSQARRAWGLACRSAFPTTVAACT